MTYDSALASIINHTCIFPLLSADESGFHCGPCLTCGEDAPELFADDDAEDADELHTLELWGDETIHYVD